MSEDEARNPIVSGCILDCPDACSFLVDAGNRTIRANPNHPFTRGRICRKGGRYFERLDALERITQPLVRKKAEGAAWGKTRVKGQLGKKNRGSTHGGFEEVSWDMALAVIAEKLNALQDRPETVLHVRGHGYRGVLAQASLNFFEAYGSATIHGSLCDDAGIEACIRDFGALEHNDPLDLLNAAGIVNWGKDLGRSSLHTGQLVREARNQGARVVTISPGGDGMEKCSERVIRIRPGTDRFLAAWLIRALWEKGAIKHETLLATANWDAFRSVLGIPNPEVFLRACDVDRKDALELLEWYISGGPTATLIGWGLQRHVFGGQNVRFINALALLSGNVGRKGGGVYFNVASGRNLGSWRASSPGRLKPDGPRRSLLLPALAWELDWADPPVEFIWVDGHNVVNQVPDSQAVAEALERPFVVCVEAFMNDTALCADVILPPALMLEREEILGSCLHDYVNYSGQVTAPRDACRSDYAILRDLGARLNPPILFPDQEECLRAGLAPLGIDLATFRAQGFARGAHPETAFLGLRFAHPDGLYRFPERLDPEPEDDPEYPLRLLSLVRGRYLHSQIPEAEQQGLPVVSVSPHNPALEGLNPDGPAFLATPLDRMAVQVRLDQTLHPQVVLIRRDGWVSLGHGPNAVIEPRQTDMGDCAAYYSQCCRLE